MIKGNKVGLRPIEESDVDLLYELANDPYISTLVVGWAMPVSKLQQRSWIAKLHENTSTFRFVVVELETGDAVGITGLWDINWHDRNALTATKLLASKTMNGYGTEAMRLIEAWGFYNLGLHRLYTSILDFNGASIHTRVKKTGWRIEGCQKEAVFRKGRWCDVYNLAMLRDEFDQLSNKDFYINALHPVDVSNTIDISCYK